MKVVREQAKIRHCVPNTPDWDDVKESIRIAIESGWLTNGTAVELFEFHLQQYLGVKHAVAVSSCTSGLMLLMKALNLKGKIAIPSYTFCGTAHAAVWCGLKPVLVDCEWDTYNIDVLDLEKQGELDAILGVHAFGNPCSLDALQDFAEDRRIPLIFDAAHAFGAVYPDCTPVGRGGVAEVFSCAPTKALCAGEGGIVTTNDDKLAELIRKGRNYGYQAPDYDCKFAGLSARMQEISAVIGFHNLKNIEKNLGAKMEIAAEYIDRLNDLEGMYTQTPNGLPSYNYFGLVVDPTRAKATATEAQKAYWRYGIETKRYFRPPLHQTSLYNKGLELPNTEYISSNNLTLPIYEGLTKGQVNEICEVMEELLS